LDPLGYFGSITSPVWEIFNNGAEIVQKVNSDPGFAVGKLNLSLVDGKIITHNKKGPDVLGSVDFSGTMFVNANNDDDFIGFVFGLF